MLTPLFVEKWCTPRARPKKVIPVKKVKEGFDMSDQIIPAKEFAQYSKPSDTLFWCMVYLHDPELYGKEISMATFAREQELKYEMMTKMDKTQEKRIATHGYGNRRVCKSKGLEPFMPIKEVISELAGTKDMSLLAVGAWLAYTQTMGTIGTTGTVGTDVYAIMKYDSMTLGIPVGSTHLSGTGLVQRGIRKPCMVLTRERNSWALTHVETMDNVVLFSSLNATLRPLSAYSTEELDTFCSLCHVDGGKYKKSKYEAVHQWMQYRLSILRNGFILSRLEKR